MHLFPLTERLLLTLSLSRSDFPRPSNLSACVCLSALSTAVLMNLAVSSCLHRIQFSGRHQQLQHSFTTLQILCCPFHPLARFSSCLLLKPPISKSPSVFALFPLAEIFTTSVKHHFYFSHISSIYHSFYSLIGQRMPTLVLYRQAEVNILLAFGHICATFVNRCVFPLNPSCNL